MWLRLSALLMLAYPFMAPLFLWFERPMYVVILLAGILLLIVLDRRQKKDLKGTGIALSGLLLIVALYIFNSASILVYFPPVLIPLGLFILFHQSLGHQAKPIITRYAEIIDGELSSEIVLYTRRLTKIWRALFLFLVVESIALALFAPMEIWAWFTHVINYLLIFLMLAGEFIYRRYRFGSSKATFGEFIKIVFTLRTKDLVDHK